MSDYIPTQDASYDNWIDNFVDTIQAGPGAFGLSAGDATALDNARDAWSDAYDITTVPATRTTPAIADKNNERASSEALCRQYAQQIQETQGITDIQRADLGITIRDEDPTPIDPPSTSPVLAIQGATPLEHTIRYADQNTPDSRAKPFGAAAMELWRTISAQAETDPSTASFMQNVTAQPFGALAAPSAAGQTATYFGRWVNAKGQVGPWSLPVSMIVAN